MRTVLPLLLIVFCAHIGATQLDAYATKSAIESRITDLRQKLAQDPYLKITSPVEYNHMVNRLAHYESELNNKFH